MRRLLLTGAALALAGLVLTPAVAATPRPDLMKMLQVFGESLDIAERYHIDEIDAVAAARAGLVGMMESLDQQSRYIAPSEFGSLSGGAEPAASAGLYLGSEDGLIIVNTAMVDRRRGPGSGSATSSPPSMVGPWSAPLTRWPARRCAASRESLWPCPCFARMAAGSTRDWR